MEIKINGDDFGLCHEVNEGIFYAFQHGILSSASLMVNFDASTEAAKIAQTHPGLRVGLHLTITDGFCVAPKSKVKALVDEDGRFLFTDSDIPGSIGNLCNKISKDHHVLEQIEREFQAQVERFQGFGLELSHIDMHHYINLIHIELFKKYDDFANRLSVSYRGLCYPMIDMLHIPPEIIQEMSTIINHSLSPCPNVSLGNLMGSKPLVLPSGEQYQGMVEKRLTSLAEEGLESVELITHPAIINELFHQSDSYSWARSLETTLVNSSKFKQFLKNNRFQLVRDLILRTGEA